MPKLLYLANIRLPTEKAHGLQIMQNCEAFADAGAEVRLWVARRVNTAEMSAVKDVGALRGAAELHHHTAALPRPVEYHPRQRLALEVDFYTQALTYTLVLLFAALFTHVDIYYSRDILTLFALSLIKPRQALVYRRICWRVGVVGAGCKGRWCGVSVRSSPSPANYKTI